ncbi:hypothetical protein ACHAO7_009392 [Fusarium culmorum]
MNRRDNHTTHHVSVEGAQSAIDNYLSLVFPASKLVLGIPFYAKWFTTKEGQTCNQVTGCPTELLENPGDGSDTGKSGSMTFEAVNFAAPPAELTISPNNSCGAGTSFICAEGACCSVRGQWQVPSVVMRATIANTKVPYGKCDGVDSSRSFRKALDNSHTDERRALNGIGIPKRGLCGRGILQTLSG